MASGLVSWRAGQIGVPVRRVKLHLQLVGGGGMFVLCLTADELQVDLELEIVRNKRPLSSLPLSSLAGFWPCPGCTSGLLCRESEKRN